MSGSSGSGGGSGGRSERDDWEDDKPTATPINPRPLDNVELPFGNWKSCSYLYVTESCAYGSSSMNFKFSNLNITTSPKSVRLTIWDLTINNYGDLDYSIDVHSSFHGNNEWKSGFGISVDSWNSVKVSGEMSLTAREENVSGKVAIGASHEYHPRNQLILILAPIIVPVVISAMQTGSCTIPRLCY